MNCTRCSDRSKAQGFDLCVKCLKREQYDLKAKNKALEEGLHDAIMYIEATCDETKPCPITFRLRQLLNKTKEG